MCTNDEETISKVAYKGNMILGNHFKGNLKDCVPIIKKSFQWQPKRLCTSNMGKIKSFIYIYKNNYCVTKYNPNEKKISFRLLLNNMESPNEEIV